MRHSAAIPSRPCSDIMDLSVNLCGRDHGSVPSHRSPCPSLEGGWNGSFPRRSALSKAIAVVRCLLPGSFPLPLNSCTPTERKSKATFKIHRRIEKCRFGESVTGRSATVYISTRYRRKWQSYGKATAKLWQSFALASLYEFYNPRRVQRTIPHER